MKDRRLREKQMIENGHRAKETEMLKEKLDALYEHLGLERVTVTVVRKIKKGKKS